MAQSQRFDGYDVIGDVHGCADKLEGLLRTLGYRPERDAYRNPHRQAVFVGDLIDRGNQQAETLEIVRAMVHADCALMVMGNHEFNAISYATPNPEVPGEFMRRHSEKNRGQHAAFLDQLQSDDLLYLQTIEWFKTLPLYLNLGGLRVVHACWNDKAIETVDKSLTPGSAMTSDFIVGANRSGAPEHLAVEVLLKGPELSLSKYGQDGFMDNDGYVRHEARIRWWDATAHDLRELAEIPRNSRLPNGLPYPNLPQTVCREEAIYDYLDETPVIYGHYWRSWEPKMNQDWTTNTACVDFSAVRGGPLVAYRWSGESRIVEHNYIKY